MDLISENQFEEERSTAKLAQEGRIAVIKWLGISRKPSGQVAKKLKDEGFSEEIIKLVLESLQEDGYLNDDAAAVRLVSQRNGRLTESRLALNQRMKRMGINDSAIESAMPESLTDMDAASQLVEGRFGKIIEQTLQQAENRRVSLETPAVKNLYYKIGRFLVSRGFSYSVIIRVLNGYFSGVDD